MGIFQKTQTRSGLRSALADMLAFLLTLAIVIPVAAGNVPADVDLLAASHFLVSGSSMSPTLEDGQRVTVDKDSLPARGDIIVSDLPEAGYAFTTGGEPQYIVKRIVGLPGEIVELGPDNMIRINGEALDEPYLTAAAKNATYAPGQQTRFELAEDMYFIVGDNRSHSCDSRYFGGVHIGQISGVVLENASDPVSVLYRVAVFVLCISVLYWVTNKLLTFLFRKVFRA